MRIQPDARIVVKENECGALIVTGSDKIRSGYGNGDCLLLNLRDFFFALSDSTERYSRASRDILERLGEEVDRVGVPERKEGWLELVNRVFAVQKYHHKATFSLAAVKRTIAGVSLCIINGGDSTVTVLNRKTGAVEYRTVANMNFAGRSKGISGVMELALKGEDYRLVMASDGLSDAARLLGKDVAGMTGSFLAREKVHLIPQRLREMIRCAVDRGMTGNYDDIGLIVADLAGLSSNGHTRIVMGGTSPVEEHAYQKKIREAGSSDEWISLQDLPMMEEHVRMCGIRVRS